MRQQLIEALTYPRLLVLEVIEEGNYPHKSLLEATGEACRNCDQPGECGWTKCLQDFSGFEEKPIEILSASLREGIRFVEAMHRNLRHDETTCTCTTCLWIRNAEHLIEECEHHLPHVDAAPVAELAAHAAAEST
jgi:hypothetical protein